MRISRLKYFLLIWLSAALIPACVTQEVCPETWMTFFVNETGLSEGKFSGQVCAVGGSCRDMPTLWAPCEANNSHPLCGPAEAWLCLAPGDFTYEIYDQDQNQAIVREGSFTMPISGESGCRARVHLSAETYVSPQSCIPAPLEDASNTENDVLISVAD